MMFGVEELVLREKILQTLGEFGVPVRIMRMTACRADIDSSAWYKARLVVLDPAASRR